MTTFLKITGQRIAAGLNFCDCYLHLTYRYLEKIFNDFLCRIKIAVKALMKIRRDDYDLLTEKIIHIEGKFSIILFAASKLNDLPVNIPCNVAISLAQSKKKCLLIDTDIKRDPISIAFDIDRDISRFIEYPQMHKTPFEDLRVWPAHNFMHKKCPDFAKIIEDANDNYDFVLINAPNIENTSIQKQAAVIADCCFIFATDKQQITALEATIKSARCKVIANVQIKG